METSREDYGIAIRSALLKKGTQQRFSLIVLIFISISLLFIENIKTKPLNYTRAIIKDTIYRGSLLVSFPSRSIGSAVSVTKDHLNLKKKYEKLNEENSKLKEKIQETDFLLLENSQLRKLIDENPKTISNFISSRVIFDKKSPYLNSFIVNSGANKNIKKGMAVLDGKNFVGRVVDTNFFSSRVLLISDLNSKIPVITQPSGNHAILSGRGNKIPTLEYLPENHTVKDGDKIYTSGQEGIFSPGIPIGIIKIEKGEVKVISFSDLSQITFVNIKIGKLNN